MVFKLTPDATTWPSLSLEPSLKLEPPHFMLFPSLS